MLAAWRSQRDAHACEAARGGGNLMPAILEALKSLATLGEGCDTLRGVFGTHRPRAKNA